MPHLCEVGRVGISVPSAYGSQVRSILSFRLFLEPSQGLLDGLLGVSSVNQEGRRRLFILIRVTSRQGSLTIVCPPCALRAHQVAPSWLCLGPPTDLVGWKQMWFLGGSDEWVVRV